MSPAPTIANQYNPFATWGGAPSDFGAGGKAYAAKKAGHNAAMAMAPAGPTYPNSGGAGSAFLSALLSMGASGIDHMLGGGVSSLAPGAAGLGAAGAGAAGAGAAGAGAAGAAGAGAGAAAAAPLAAAAAI